MLLLSILIQGECKKTVPSIWDDTPWPLPPNCKPTNPQAAYVNISDYLTFQTHDRSGKGSGNDNVRLSISKGVFSTAYPDPIDIAGKHGVQLINASGFARLNTATGGVEDDSVIDVSFYARGLDIGAAESEKNLSGIFRVVSTDFRGWGGRYVPFMRRRSSDGFQRESGGGISGNFIQHGCSGQGEPGFPMLKSRVSTWGHGAVFLNDALLLGNVWMHSMYTNRYRDPETRAIYADASRTAYYDPKECNKAFVSEDGSMQFTLVIARWCVDDNPKKIHPATDLDMVMTFDNVIEIE